MLKVGIWAHVSVVALLFHFTFFFRGMHLVPNGQLVWVTDTLFLSFFRAGYGMAVQPSRAPAQPALGLFELHPSKLHSATTSTVEGKQKLKTLPSSLFLCSPQEHQNALVGVTLHGRAQFQLGLLSKEARNT